MKKETKQEEGTLTLKEPDRIYEEVIEELGKKSKVKRFKEWLVLNFVLPFITGKKVYSDEPLIEYTEFKSFGGCYYITEIKWR